MNPILFPFTKKGFVHELVERVGRWLIVRRQRVGSEREHFEVVRPVESRREYRDGAWRECAPREVYPSSEKWGADGFTLPDLEAARRKLADLGA
jgi:hypothetical protein